MAREAKPTGRGAGHEIYTRRFLAIYDVLILGFYLRHVWRCPREVLAERYRTHIGASYLDVGPGTGYSSTSPEQPRGSRSRWWTMPRSWPMPPSACPANAPATVRADACAPLPAALNLVLHGIDGAEPCDGGCRTILADVVVVSPGGRVGFRQSRGVPSGWGGSMPVVTRPER